MHKNIYPKPMREKKSGPGGYYLTCKRVYFYSMLDEDMFFEWATKHIRCVDNAEGAGDEIYLDLEDNELDFNDMQELTALFFRYQIDMSQLEPFINEKNKDAAALRMKKITPKKSVSRGTKSQISKNGISG